jgi:hypothetical protein
MWEVVCMIIAVFLVVLGIASTIIKLLDRNRLHVTLWSEVIMLTIGISYLIWYCN